MKARTDGFPVEEYSDTQDPSTRTNTLILLLLGIRLLYGAAAALSVQTAPLVLAVVNWVYLFSTYLITALLIWRERSRLSQYRMGKLAVILFIISSPYQILLNLLQLAHFSLFSTLTLLPVSLWLLAALLRERQNHLHNPPSLKRWLLIGSVIGILAGIGSGLLIRNQAGHLVNLGAILPLLLLPTIQISSAAVSEEPLFRGFFWGYLQKRGWQEHWIWLFQAVLFGVGHIYYWPSGDYLSLLIGPIAALILGWISWKARDIAPSMLAHGFLNATAQVVGELTAAR